MYRKHAKAIEFEILAKNVYQCELKVTPEEQLILNEKTQ